MFNLIKNVYELGSDLGEVVLWLSSLGGELCIEVLDWGLGMSEVVLV